MNGGNSMEWIIKPRSTPGEGSGGGCASKACTGHGCVGYGCAYVYVPFFIH